MKTPILQFGTSCRTCARGLLIGDNGEKYCPVCTRFAPVILEPFVAIVGAEIVEEAADLDELLAVLAEITDDKPAEDLVITRGQRRDDPLC